MSSLFAPAETLIGRLSYRWKIVVTSVLFIIPLAYLWSHVLSETTGNLARMQTELDGNRYIQQVRKVFELVPQHRGLSQGILKGNDAARTKLAAVQQKLRPAFEALQEIDKTLGPLFNTSSQVADARRQWEALAADGLSLAPPESFKRHTKIIMGLHRLMAYVADESGLSVDRDLATALSTRAMIDELLMVAEFSGRTRGLGTGIAAKGSFTSDNFAKLSSNIDAIQQHQQLLIGKLAHIKQKNPAVHQLIAADAEQANQAISGLITFVRNGMLNTETISVGSSEVFQKGTETISKTFSLFDRLSEITGQQLNERVGAQQGTLASSIIVTSICLVVLVYFGLAFMRVLTHSIEQIGEGTEQIASGDLTTRIHIPTRDEMANIQNSMNRMTENFGQMVGDVVSAGHGVATSASQIATTTTQTHRVMDEQQSLIAQVATAINQMAASIHGVANSAADAAEATRHANQKVHEGQQVVENSTKAIDALAQEVQHAADVVSKVEADSEEIGGVLDVIRSIAEQTNLLALNAAIEAARAGEQGRGFAVVADEVRTLASRTQNSTEEIHSMIERLQHGTSQATKVMESSKTKAMNGVEESRMTSDALQEMATAIARISSMSTEIASAAEQQSSVTEEINQNIVKINDSSHLTKLSAAEAAQASDNLASSSQQLNAATSRFIL